LRSRPAWLWVFAIGQFPQDRGRHRRSRRAIILRLAASFSPHKGSNHFRSIDLGAKMLLGFGGLGFMAYRRKKPGALCGSSDAFRTWRRDHIVSTRTFVSTLRRFAATVPSKKSTFAGIFSDVRFSNFATVSTQLRGEGRDQRRPFIWVR
jgi:hypothetical protein